MFSAHSMKFGNRTHESEKLGSCDDWPAFAISPDQARASSDMPVCNVSGGSPSSARKSFTQPATVVSSTVAAAGVAAASSGCAAPAGTTAANPATRIAVTSTTSERERASIPSTCRTAVTVGCDNWGRPVRSLRITHCPTFRANMRGKRPRKEMAPRRSVPETFQVQETEVLEVRVAVRGSHVDVGPEVEEVHLHDHGPDAIPAEHAQ